MSLVKYLAAGFAWAASRSQPLPLRQTLRSMKVISKTALGREIFACEQTQLQSLLADHFGFHLMELCCCGAGNAPLKTTIQHSFRLSPGAGCGAQALCELERLPFDDEALDVVILRHTLDYAQNPHQVLREVERVLVSHGTLVIVGFNPFSFQGLWRFVMQWFSSHCLWRWNALRAGRISDWLQLLECEPQQVLRGFYRPPVNNATVLKSLSWFEKLGARLKLPFGGYYILVAKKERSQPVNRKPVWRKLAPVAGFIPETASGMSQGAGRRQIQMKEEHKH